MTHAVVVVVVAFEAAPVLDRCLAELRGGSFEITVVDNSSSPAVRAVSDAHSVTYVDSRSNLGFAAGVNRAIRPLLENGTARHVLLLNPDAVVSPLAIETLVAHLRENPRVGAVAPRLVGLDGSEQRVLWPYPSPFRHACEAMGMGRLPSRSKFAVGAVLLLRWEALQDVGLFDERFFLYAEEADWQRRALAQGWSSTQCRRALALHVGAGTSADAVAREALFHAGQETYVRKWYGSLGWALYRAAAIAGAGARAAVLHGRRREAARRALLYVRGPRKSAGLG